MSELLRVEGLHIAVEGKEILKGLDLTINTGETHVIMGSNGAGKSTLFNAIMGNPKYVVTAGKIFFEGKDITDAPVNERAKAGIFMAFQQPIAVQGISVENFIRNAKSTVSGQQQRIMPFRKKLHAQMEQLKMDKSYAERYVNDGFSGGERKKTEILQMCMLEPKLTMLDEIDSGLDVDAVRIVSETVSKYHNENNSILVITHHSEILQHLKPDFVHILIDGKIVKDFPNTHMLKKARLRRIQRIVGGTAMADNKEKLVEQEKEKLAEERQKIDTFADFGNMYNFKKDFTYSYKTDAGLTEDIVREISEKKHEPEWMLNFRLKSLDIFNHMDYPDWGPDISELDMDNIVTYVRPNAQMKADWNDVPDDIKDTFDRLGIPEAEKTSLAGVGAQYDSEVVYHSIQDELVQQGVVYTDFDTALEKYEDIVKAHFMKLVPPTDHKFAALHGAVWSGGSFVYVPAGVDVSIPLQSYFRLNAPGAGQFEHTMIIVEKGAKVHFIEGCSAPKYNVANLHAGCVELFIGDDASLTYSTIENWSKNMYNLNTKRAIVGKNGTINWVTGSFGSHTSCLYPMSILQGEGAHCEFTGVTFAGKGQYLDTGSKVVHNAPNTTSNINSKSISKSGGVCIYRGSVVINPPADGAKANVSCESLMLDEESQSDTIPAIVVKNDNIDLGHEASIGRISDDAIFYLMSRGLSEDEARAMLVRGFVEPVSKALPLEYAVEMNNLINLELKGSLK